MEITGLSNINDTNSKSVALNLFQDALGVEVKESDVSKCYVKQKRGREMTDRNKESKPIVFIQLSDLSLKHRIMKEKSIRKQRLNSWAVDSSSTTSSGRREIYINDALTKFTHALLMKAKTVKKEKSYKFVWIKK